MNFTFKQMLAIFLVVIAVANIFFLIGNRTGKVSTENQGSSTPLTVETAIEATSGISNVAPDSGTATKPVVAPVAVAPAPAPTQVAVTPSSSAVVGKSAPEFVRPGGFSNTDPFLLKDLKGKKIVLLEFWTTSSMNSVRTTQYLNDWYAKYHNFGLTIVAVHTPRFSFERSKTVVDQFAYTHNMSYPIVMDNGAETWTAYKNTTWPHLYLIDLDSRIVYDHSGEGAYDATERKLLVLLNDRAAKLKLPAPPDQKISKLVGDTTDLTLLKSSEALFGAGRNSSLANGISGREGTQTFDTITEPKLNKQYLFGSWNIMHESAESLTEHTSILYRFNAKRVFTIMGAQKMVRVRVLLDGKPLTETNMGKDIRIEKDESVFYVDREHFYDIVNSSAGYGEHTIELIPESGGLNIYTLTFG